ncbi:MAG: PAS domain S-box protein [Desulfobulbaceae bacterium]|nr:PAS domain S-box protein [Desulfobulbaceae bacterium]HIJ78271.1 PAS domain S-box protein [Deltaproteobacteria bacterium]
MQNKANERRSVVRMPFTLKFRLRDDESASHTYPARSYNIHSSGILVETNAPVTVDMDVELWPDDYSMDVQYVHGRICWVKPINGGSDFRCGITFERKIDWPIPLPVLTKTYVSQPVTGETTPSDFVLDSILDGVFSVDQKWRITSFNRAAEELTGWRREDAIGKTCQEVFKSNCCGKDECVMAESLRTGKPVENRYIEITHANGNKIGTSISASPLLDSGGRVLGGVQVFRRSAG